MKLRYKLLTLLALTSFALPLTSCNEETSSTSSGVTLENAIRYLSKMYENDAGARVATFYRVSVINNYNVTWSIEDLNGPDGVVSVGETDTNTKMTPIVIKWEQGVATDVVSFALTATISNGEESLSKKFPGFSVPKWGPSETKQAIEDGIKQEPNKWVSEKEYSILGTVTATVGNSFYVQDGDYGFYVYNKQVEGLEIGKKVLVFTTITNYSGLIESKTISSATIIGDGDKVTPKEYTSLSDIKQENQSTLVTLKNLKFDSLGTKWNDPTQSEGFSFYFGSDRTQARRDKYIDDSLEEEIINKVKGMKKDDTFDLVGVVSSWYNSSAQFSLTSPDQIVIHQA